MPSEYQHVKPGEWIRVPKKGWRDQCCGCGMVHRVNLRITNGHIEIQSFIDGPATGGARKNKAPK